MAEDFCDEDVLGHVFGFKAVAADGGVGASQVSWFPGKGEGAEGSRNVFGELRAGEVLRERSLASSAMMFFGSARTGIG
jgi:hypothetical protein